MGKNKKTIKIAIIGAGPSGIAAGRELLQQGFKNFTIFEKENAAGGTWHMQTYPGLACDVWAHSYTYSYAPNPNWSKSFAGQPEIEAYLQKCAKDFGLEPFIQFNRRIQSAQLQDNKRWKLTFEDDTADQFDIIINAMGNQHTPLYPNLVGASTFKGDSWHSTHWNHDVDLTGKKVTVIGSAAAAVQIVPEIAPLVDHLTILQRSPNWIVPRNNKTYSPLMRNLFNRFPLLMRLFRNGQGYLMNMVHGAVIMGNKRMGMFENMGRKFIEKAVNDPELRKAVIPDTHYGCKRPLVSDDFYPALNRENVTLIPFGAAEITEHGVTSTNGQKIDSDIIIYCTGYKVLDFDRINVVGKEGKVLADKMAESPQAFKGIAVEGFPNYFLGTGPNALVLSVSYFKSIEANFKCIVDLISEMLERNVDAVDVNPQRNQQYNEWVSRECKKFSWASGTCHNYYTTDSGDSPFLYPDDYKSFLKMREECTLEEFDPC